MDLEKMGKFIAKLRNEAKLTQVQLGEMLGVENKTISKWEKGINTPDVTMLIALSNIFNVRVEELVKGEYIEKDRKEIAYLKANNKTPKENSKNKKIFILSLIIVLLLIILLLVYKEIKNNNDSNSDTITIDLKNDPETPLNVSGCIMYSNNSTMYVIKGISYETRGNDPVGKYLITQYEVKLLVDDNMVGTYTHNFDSNKALDDAIDNLAFTVVSKNQFNKKSKIKIQVKYTTSDNDKEITETNLFL